jgi:hypothetical protein
MGNAPLLLSLAGLAGPALLAQSPAVCQVSRPTATFEVGYVPSAPELDSDPQSTVWKNARRVFMVRDCTRVLDYPDLKTEIRGFWTATDLYLLFLSPYRSLNVFQPPEHDRPRRGLWDRDVVEIFLGDDWENIRHYREFEIAPTADWIDLAIDLDRRGQDRNWRSGWQTTARVDEQAKIWHAACRIPLQSVSSNPVRPGTRWRANLYRIDGEGPDARRRFLCWQPTCVQNRDPNHVPENFGTLVFGQ